MEWFVAGLDCLLRHLPPEFQESPQVTTLELCSSMIRRLFLSLFAGLLLAASAQAGVELPPIISDHMVIQRDKPVILWGWMPQARL